MVVDILVGWRCHCRRGVRQWFIVSLCRCLRLQYLLFVCLGIDALFEIPMRIGKGD